MMGEFFLGVVEDRHDPKKLGRVRVRVLGAHTDDRKVLVPIDSLPWSFVMQPANSSTSGAPLSQLVEGTWVVVMYMDQNMQDPLVVGSIPGIDQERPNYNIGFSDPFGVYPRWVAPGSEGGSTPPDSNLSLVTDESRWTEHPTYKARVDTRVLKIPRARKYEIPTVSAAVPDEEYQRSTFDEPDLRGLQTSLYPYNSVTEYEGGMVEEYDSTTENTRITQMHKSGSYTEILHDGATTTKIVGDAFTITLKDHNMYVEGDLNLTVEGNMRHYVNGDYTLEVGGNMHTYVEGNRETKVDSNDLLEVFGDQSTNILLKQSIHVGEDQTILVDGNHIETIGGTSDLVVRGNRSQTITADSAIVTTGNESILTIGKRLITTEGIHRFESIDNIEFDTDADLNQRITGDENTVVSAMNITAPDNVNVNGDVIADGISLKTHVHGGVSSGPSNTGQPV